MIINSNKNKRVRKQWLSHYSSPSFLNFIITLSIARESGINRSLYSPYTIIIIVTPMRTVCKVLSFEEMCQGDSIGASKFDQDDDGDGNGC